MCVWGGGPWTYPPAMASCRSICLCAGVVEGRDPHSNSLEIRSASRGVGEAGGGGGPVGEGDLLVSQRVTKGPIYVPPFPL